MDRNKRKEIQKQLRKDIDDFYKDESLSNSARKINRVAIGTVTSVLTSFPLFELWRWIDATRLVENYVYIDSVTRGIVVAVLGVISAVTLGIIVSSPSQKNT